MRKNQSELVDNTKHLGGACMRRCAFLLLLVLVIIANESRGEAPLFLGTGPYTVPQVSTGPEWSWTNKVTPRRSVFIVDEGGSRVSTYYFRDARSEQALSANITKWCKLNNCAISKVIEAKDGYEVHVAKATAPRAPAVQQPVDVATKEQEIAVLDGEIKSLQDALAAKMEQRATLKASLTK